VFTGIVAGTGVITEVKRQPGFQRMVLALPRSSDSPPSVGASISVDGVCLTVSKVSEGHVEVDLMQETLSRTTLGMLAEQGRFNFERSFSSGQEVGGHILSGHIDTRASIVAIETPPHNYVITFQVPAEWMKYIFSKGFIALNGCSLTVTDPDYVAQTFKVWLIPETLRVTTFGEKKIGDFVNVEVDRTTQVIVDTVERFLQAHLKDLSRS
jgi:riboflavin synthase